jgi:hypothetical protein
MHADTCQPWSLCWKPNGATNEVRYRQRLSFDEENDALNIAQVKKMERGLRSIETGGGASSQILSAAEDLSGVSPEVSVVKPGYIVGTADG